MNITLDLDGERSFASIVDGSCLIEVLAVTNVAIEGRFVPTLVESAGSSGGVTGQLTDGWFRAEVDL